MSDSKSQSRRNSQAGPEPQTDKIETSSEESISSSNSHDSKKSRSSLYDSMSATTVSSSFLSKSESGPFSETSQSSGALRRAASVWKIIESDIRQSQLKRKKSIDFTQNLVRRKKSFLLVDSNHQHHLHHHDHTNRYVRKEEVNRRASIASIKEFGKQKFVREGGKLRRKKSVQMFASQPFHTQFNHHVSPVAHIQKTKLSKRAMRLIEEEAMKLHDIDLVSRRQSRIQLVKPKIWTEPRISWLENLEAETSKTLTKTYHEMDKKYKNDMCCFPFSTYSTLNKEQAQSYRYFALENDSDSDSE